MMLALLTLIAGVVLWPSFGYARSDDEGCFVKGTLHIHVLLTRSVKFTAFTPSNGTIFKAKMKCGKRDYAADSFYMSNSEVTMMRYDDNSLTPTKKCWSGKTTEAGWTDFDLKFGEAYELVDGRGQSHIPERISPKCLIKEVEIQNGSFITQCSEGMAKWEVREGRCAFVPLFLSAEDGNLLNLILTSKDKFLPVFHFGEQKVELGIQNESVVISKDNVTALPPSPLNVVLLFEQNDGFISCIMKTDGLLLTKVILESKPRHVKVCSEENTKFLLMLKMKTTIALNNEGQSSDFSRWGLPVLLVLNAIAFVFILLYRLSERQNNLVVGITQVNPSPSPSPGLDPLPVSPTPLEDFATTAHDSEASEEGVYCEMTLLPSMNHPPLSFDTECETINDTYISADLY